MCRGLFWHIGIGTWRCSFCPCSCLTLDATVPLGKDGALHVRPSLLGEGMQVSRGRGWDHAGAPGWVLELEWAGTGPTYTRERSACFHQLRSWPLVATSPHPSMQRFSECAEK